jgi:hypothetical protein
MPRLDSSAIRRVTYNPNTQKMNVQFVGTGKQYTFVGVPEDVYDDFINSSSAGQFFNDNIKDDYIAEPSEFVSSVRFDRPSEDEFYESTDLMKLGLSVLGEDVKQSSLEAELDKLISQEEPERLRSGIKVTAPFKLKMATSPKPTSDGFAPDPFVGKNSPLKDLPGMVPKRRGSEGGQFKPLGWTLDPSTVPYRKLPDLQYGDPGYEPPGSPYFPGGQVGGEIPRKPYVMQKFTGRGRQR